MTTDGGEKGWLLASFSSSLTFLSFLRPSGSQERERIGQREKIERKRKEEKKRGKKSRLRPKNSCSFCSSPKGKRKGKKCKNLNFSDKAVGVRSLHNGGGGGGAGWFRRKRLNKNRNVGAGIWNCCSPLNILKLHSHGPHGATSSESLFGITLPARMLLVRVNTWIHPNIFYQEFV